MFAIDATFEDCRIMATEQSPKYNTEGVLIVPETSNLMDVHFVDNPSGNVFRKTLSMVEVGKLVCYAASGMDGNDIAITHADCHDMLEGCPNQCRPIP